MKSYLKSIVRDGGPGRFGLGVELFRLDADESGLTESEAEEVSEEETGSTAILRVYEQIGESFWDESGMSVKKFAEALDGLEGIAKLNIHINSLGGDTHTAQAIYNLIGDFKADKTSFIDGVAASAATVVALGADKVVMRKNSNFMIHHPWSVAIGSANDMRKAAEDLDAVTEPIVNVYKDQTGNKISKAKIIELMDDETWMTAQEALDYGFVDEVRGKVNPIASVSRGKIFCNGAILNIGKYQYHNIPKFVIKPELKPKQKKDNKSMTLDELNQADPDLISSIRADAAKAERDRLSALNAMMAPGLEAIIAKAIEDGSAPASIAMECFSIMKDSAASKSRVDALKRDATATNGVVASDAPLLKPLGKGEKKGSALLVQAFQKDKSQQARAKSGGRLMLN